jgi:hypothetical protein
MRGPNVTTATIEQTTAADDLANQVDVADGYAYNLDHLWRACGSPEGRDPRSWSSRDMAGWFIQGTAVYFANRDRASGMKAKDRSEGVIDEVFFTLTSSPRPDVDWRLGDALGTHVIARAYAEFLDESDAQG